MDKGFKGWKVVGILLFRTDPEIDFHSGWVSFASRQSPLYGIADLLGLGIAGSFHYHEMGIIVLVHDLIVFQHRGRSPSGKVEPGFRIQGIAVSGVTMFIDPCRNASILERSLCGEPIKDNSIPIGTLDKFSDDLATVREFIHLDVDGALH